jgi:hypothetical protein
MGSVIPGPISMGICWTIFWSCGVQCGSLWIPPLGLLAVVLARKYPDVATEWPAIAPPATAATAASAMATCTEMAKPTAGTAVAATIIALLPTVVAAPLADCKATNSVINLLFATTRERASG